MMWKDEGRQISSKRKSENKSINLNKNIHSDEQDPNTASESGTELVDGAEGV